MRSNRTVDSLMKWDQSYLGKKSATISEYFSAKKSTPENEADPALDGVDLEEAEGDTELDELLGKLSPDEDIDKEIEDFLANEPEERRKAREELTVRMLVEDRMQNEIMRDLHVNTFPLPPEPSRAAAEKTAFFVDLETVFDDLPDYPYAKLRPLIPPEDQLVEWADDFDPGSDDEKGESDVETEKPARKEPSKEGPSRRAPSKSAPSRGEKPSRKEEPLRRPKVSRKSSLGRCMKTQQPVKKPILRSAMKRKADDAAGNDEKRVNFG